MNPLGASLRAVCEEAVAELAQLLSSNKNLDMTRLLRVIRSTVIGGGDQNKLSLLSIISEGLVFSKLPAKARVTALTHISQFLQTDDAGGGSNVHSEASEGPTVSSSSSSSSSFSSSSSTEKQQPRSHSVVQAKVVMILLDVAMLDPVSSLRREALRALLPMRQGLLQAGGKDLLRVAVFKCRDKAVEVRVTAFELLEEAMRDWMSLPAPAPSPAPPSQQSLLSHEELIALTKHILQVIMHSHTHSHIGIQNGDGHHVFIHQYIHLS
jgi:hypothetical protein